MQISKKKFVVIFSIFILLACAFFVTANNSNVSDLRNWVKVQIISPVESNGAIPVNIQDQTTRPFDIRVNQILNQNITLAVTPTVNSYDVTLTAGHGVITGDSLALVEQNGEPQLWFGVVKNVVGDVITMDSPAPYPFTIENTSVFTFNNDFSVDGSVTPQIYSITNFFEDSVDITRFIFHCLDQTAMDDSKFCGINELDRGIVLRKKRADGTYLNYWNVKSNGDWADLAYDKSYDDKAPAGFYGFSSRLTYGGQSKHGVVIRLDTNESIELLIQDDLTGLDLTSLMVQGHFVTD